MADETPLSGAMGFATLRPTYPEASAQLVELMRATLRHAQEITAAVGEAEVTASRAQSAVSAVDTATTQAERRVVESEIDKLSAWLAPPAPTTDKGNQRYAAPAYYTSAVTSTSMASSTALAADSTPRFVTEKAAASQTASADQPAAPEKADSGTWPPGSTSGDGSGQCGDAEHASAQGAGGAEASNSGSEKHIALEMAEEIETTVMWVQQLLESVHFIDSDTKLEPGASLLSIVQPGRRHQKDVALHQSKKVFREKKEAEEEDDLNTSLFRRLRGEALQAVSTQRAAIASRE